MPLVDSHCHLHFEPLRDDIEAVLARAHECGVAHMLCVSVGLSDIGPIQEIMRHDPGIFGSVGIHPNEAGATGSLVDDLVRLSAQDRMVAIGETGLDYYRLEEPDAARQQRQFRAHIAAARRVGKPLIIHTREAAADTLHILRDEQAADIGGVLHCFTESADFARAVLDQNFYISFSGIVTFKNAHALRDVARLVPDDRLLIETDAPYLAPVPHRGQSNEPSYVTHVAQCLADIRGVSREQIADLTARNFFALFTHAASAVAVS
ncbi:TatD family hydrolase [Acidiferrobacter sp.]|uniref:TatD family hydrolase n=1 Tax=Acidiferrobacter sp. TaxID=1872107 RepID=UPI002618AFCF|nr:TatD family hydrolase [Acidiferrobacter sp.]